MAKTIKFNLILDGYPVRDLEGVREHFSIEDMLKYYKNGLLLRWLDVRGYKEEYEEVTKIPNSATDKDVIKQLSFILKVEMLDAVIEKSIAILEYRKEEERKLAVYENHKHRKERIINDYHKGYVELIHHMQDHQDNMELLKVDAIQMIDAYWNLFTLDAVRLYNQLEKNAPKAIFAMLTQEKIRREWMGQYSNICTRIQHSLQPEKLKVVLGNDLKSVKQNTYGNFKDVEPLGQKVMILWLHDSAYIRSQREEDFQMQLSSKEVNGKLYVLDGLKYQSLLIAAEVLYMEV